MIRALLVTLALATIATAQFLPNPPPPTPPGQQNTLFASLTKWPNIAIITNNQFPHLELTGWPGAYYEIWACPHPPFPGWEETLYGSCDMPMGYYDFFLAWSGHIGPSNGQTSAGLTIIGPITYQPPPGIVLTLQGIVEDPINTPYGYLLTAALLIVTL